MASNEGLHTGSALTQECSKVLFVTGAGHSGTTLLGMMLGTHPNALFAGEIQEYGLKDNSLCRTCGENCSVWSNLDTRKNVYDELAHKSGKSIVIDTSKKILEWVTPAVASLTGRDVSMILMVRDPRGIVVSERRKEPLLSPKEIVEKWRAQMRRCEILALNFPGPVVRVQYETLATEPERALQAVCTSVGLSYTKTMLLPWNTPGHQLGGNIGVWALASGHTSKLSPKKFRYYHGHERVIKLDERWKQELSDAEVQEIKDTAKSLFYTYGWEGYNDFTYDGTPSRND